MRNSRKGTVLLVVLFLAGVATSHRHNRHRHADEENTSINVNQDVESDKKDDPQDASMTKKIKEASGTLPISSKRFEKMLQKAILKIITGKLSKADVFLLKSLNYSLEEVLAIRERELGRKLMEKERKTESDQDEARRRVNKDSGNKYISNKDPSRKFDKVLKDNNYLPRYSEDTGNHMEADYEDTKDPVKQSSKGSKDPQEARNLDYEAYNRQSVLDYEAAASRMDYKQSWDDGSVDLVNYKESAKKIVPEESVENLHESFDRAMEPHVVFKIRYDDSEFDSNSDERIKSQEMTENASTSNDPGSTFHNVDAPSRQSIPVVYRLGPMARPGEHYEDYAATTEVPSTTFSSTDNTSRTSEDQVLGSSSGSDSSDNLRIDLTTGSDHRDGLTDDPTKIHNDSLAVEDSEKLEKNFNSSRTNTEYEGLEWVEDDVYRVIPEAIELLNYDNDENATSDDYHENSSYQNLRVFTDDPGDNDTMGYQKDIPDAVQLFMANANVTLDNYPSTNMTSYQQMALAHRRDGNLSSSYGSQGQRAIEDIKLRVLTLTGRFNLSTSLNQVQRERLTMFSPSCQIPRNTDAEAWADPLLMNMHFQLNLTSGEHVVAAKLRLFKLAQDNLTAVTGNAGVFDEDEEDEKKIRISIYFYTKSLKKHRSKKRLMDSKVTSLTSKGSHLALDVRQGLRFWRLNQRNSHGNGNNHGLVVQVEDQDGRPLKPAQYIQQPSCDTAEQDADDKAYQRQPAFFVRACSRYARVVNGETVTYVDCRSSQRRSG